MEVRLLLGWLLLLLLQLPDRTHTSCITNLLNNIYENGTLVRIWGCRDYRYWLTNSGRMVMARPGDSNWYYTGQCFCTKNDNPCNTAAPTPAGAHVKKTLPSRAGNNLYGVYYECDSGSLTVNGYPGILMQCLGGIWVNNSDYCVQAPQELPLIAYNATVTPMRIWICPHYKFWLGNNYRMVMALSSESTWNNPGNCQNDMTLQSFLCNSYAPPPSGAHVVQNFTWYVPYYSRTVLYGVYFECDSGNLTVSGYPGILLQCLNTVWKTTPSDSCVQATSSSSFPPVILFENGTVQVWGCQTLSQGLNTNKRMVIAVSSDPALSKPGNCIVTNDTKECTYPPPQLQNAHVVQNFIWNTSSSVYGVYYECNGGRYLVSGSPGLLTQCVSGTWSSFSENCVPVPRDCCVMRNKNPNIYGMQEAVLGVGYNSSWTIKALCDMGLEPGSYEGGWTLVLWHSTQSAEDLQLSLSSYTEGYGQPNINGPNSYFIGLENLVALNWDKNSTRHLVMKNSLVVGCVKELSSSAGGPAVSRKVFLCCGI
ncbi:uncharacterized protein [Cherax quadricarinatus]|uniref:uncharacterized protein n=1 Tax=Cherax quadricarinatus TaxID=27406 RepID=UPI00387E2371